MTCKDCKFFVQGEGRSGGCSKKQYATHRSGHVQRKSDGTPDKIEYDLCKKCHDKIIKYVATEREKLNEN